MKDFLILVINPGSTTTKIAVYKNEDIIFNSNIRHHKDELRGYTKVTGQYDFRKKIILQELQVANIKLTDLDIIMSRGGLLKPLESGVYEINEALRQDLTIGRLGDHASNLGGILAYEICNHIPGLKSYIADPVIVDELQDVARITGWPQIQRRSVFHALNQKAVARLYSKFLNKKYEDLNLIVAHMGGGISVGAHCKGKVIDVNNALDGDGPFSPERSGSLPVGDLVKLCFNGNFTYDQIKKMISSEGGLVAHFGTTDVLEIEKRTNDQHAKLIIQAMAYQVGKEIGSLAAVLKGKTDAIIITGGIAKNETIVNYIKEMISFIAPIWMYAGETEMEALALNAMLVLKGEITPKKYY